MEVDEGKQSSSRPSCCWDVSDESSSRSPGLLLVTMLPANQSVSSCFNQICIGIVSVRNVRIFTVLAVYMYCSINRCTPPPSLTHWVKAIVMFNIYFGFYDFSFACGACTEGFLYYGNVSSMKF